MPKKAKEKIRESDFQKVEKKVIRNTSKKNKSTIVVDTEYYDLPFRYNMTIVRILYQTPNSLFVYWDISDNDKKLYIEKYGKDFFKRTKPYLIIKNETMDYTFEIEVNDYANSWYLHINDADCKYKIELTRKFIDNHSNKYISITASNGINTPNDHILFDKLSESISFKNVKSDVTEEKDISSISFMKNLKKVYNTYDLYKELYNDNLLSNTYLNLPSSDSSSTFK